MDSRHIRDLCEAYVAVYDDELRDELETSDSLDEDFSFVDDLSDNELTLVMETILLEGQYTLDECLDLIDYSILQEEAILSEARPTPRQLADRKEARKAREAEMRKSSSQAARRSTAYDVKQRLGRIGAAAGRAAENLASRVRSGASRAKTYAGGVSSAVQGGAAEAGRKLTAAKERIKGGLARIGRAARAGVSAAKKEFSGQAEREANARTTGRQMRRAAGRQAAAQRAKDTSDFERPTPSRERTSTGSVGAGTSGTIRSTRTTLGRGPSSSGRALPPVGTTKAGRQLTTSQRRMQTDAQNLRLQRRLGIKQEELELILPYILEDFINEGYANDYDEAYEILESLNDYDFEDLVESYIEENVEVEDYYDDIMNYLLDEGYAADEESANVIMANMSEEWREEILEAKSDEGLPDKLKVAARRRRQGSSMDWDYDDSHRQAEHRGNRGVRKKPGKKSFSSVRHGERISYDGRIPGEYSREKKYLSRLSPEERAERMKQNKRSLSRPRPRVGGKRGLPG